MINQRFKSWKNFFKNLIIKTEFTKWKKNKIRIKIFINSNIIIKIINRYKLRFQMKNFKAKNFIINSWSRKSIILMKKQINYKWKFKNYPSTNKTTK